MPTSPLCLGQLFPPPPQEELWIFLDDYVVSTNFFQVAASPLGPWRNFTAPWSPRAAAAFTTSWNSTVAYFASGMSFTNGDVDPNLPTFGDAWRIDTSVCLLGPNAAVCSGQGVADLDSVVCRCYAGASGTYCEQGSSASNSQAGSVAGGPAQVAGGIIGFIICAVAALFVYNRFFAGSVPIVDKVIDVAQDAASEVARRARSLSGGSAGSAFLARATSSPGKGGARTSASSSPTAYGALRTDEVSAL